MMVNAKQLKMHAAKTVSTKSSFQKKHKEKKNFTSVVAFLLVITLIAFSSLLCVWSNTQVISLGYEISKANKEKKALQHMNKKLTLELVTLTSLHRVEDIAKRELKLTSPKPEQMVIIR